MKTTDADTMVIDEPVTRKAGTKSAAKPADESRAHGQLQARKNPRFTLMGKFFPEADAKVSVFDHGLLYGDGIFEGIRFYNGRVFRLEEHLARLWDSARSIALQMPMSMGEMTEALLETIRQNELHDGYIRLLVTRGGATWA